MEDEASRLFEDPIDSLMELGEIDCLEQVEPTTIQAILQLISREQNDHPDSPDANGMPSTENVRGSLCGGLPGWNYASPFCPVTVAVDDADKEMESRFISEANSVLENVLNEVKGLKSHDDHDENSDEGAMRLDRLTCLVF